MKLTTKQKIYGILNLILALIAAFFVINLLISCDVSKDAFKNKSEITTKEITEVITKRIGDTVHYSVPNITYRDTVIYSVNHQGTTLKTIYDNSGNITSIDCYASAIDEIRRSNKELIENLKIKDNHKEEKANFDWMIPIFVVIGCMGFFALLFIFLYFKAKSKII